MEYSDILKCLKTLQECKNGNSESCNKIEEKCLKKLELTLESLSSLKQKEDIHSYIYNILKHIDKYNILKDIDEKYDIKTQTDEKKLKNTINIFIRYFEYLQKIESNKNKKEDLEKIKKRIKNKEKFFDNKIKKRLINLIEKYLKILQQNEENRRIRETTDSSPSLN